MLILVTLLIPALAPDLGRWIIYAALAGAAIAIPALVRVRQDPGARIALSTEGGVHRRCATCGRSEQEPSRSRAALGEGESGPTILAAADC